MRGELLVPLGREHLQYLRAIEVHPNVAFHWRHSGRHPDPAGYEDSAWDDVLCSFLVMAESSPTGRAVGLVSAYHPDMVNGHCRVAALRFDAPSANLRTTVAVARGFIQLLDYVFAGWPFRKVYCEVPEFNLSQFRGLVRSIAQVEGSLDDYIFHADRYWSLTFLSISRQDWRVARRRFDRLVTDA